MRPMLAGKFDEKLQRFPALVSPKLDGIRALVSGGVVHSRSWKRLPNPFVQEVFGMPLLNGLDGELIVGSPTAKNCMQATGSGVMSYQGRPNVTFHVFDCFSGPPQAFCDRLMRVNALLRDFAIPRVTAVPQQMVYNLEELYEEEKHALQAGFEGIIVRDPEAFYKQGRSTTREGGMLKVKRFVDSEARILSCVELMHNANEAQLDERGYTKRSHAQDGKVPMGILGALRVEDIYSGQEFEIGTGFTEHDRVKLWQQRECLHGLIVKYKHFAYGQKEKPRQPVFLGFRHLEDM